MKKINSLKTFLMLVIIAAGISTAIAQETLANWTFANWKGGAAAGVPAGQLLTAPIFADAGTQATTAEIGTENMYTDGEGGTVRSWGTPSAAGYVRSSSAAVGTYCRIIGISTLGYTTIIVTAGHAPDTSAHYFYLQLEYRIGSTGTWTPVGDPVLIDVVSETTIPAKFNGVQLPAASEHVAALEIRFRVSSLVGTAGQDRIDNITITGVKDIGAGIISGENNSTKVFAANNKINIQGAQGLHATIYSISGSKVFEVKSLNAQQEINVSGNTIYIVNIAGKAFKVSL